MVDACKTRLINAHEGNILMFLFINHCWTWCNWKANRHNLYVTNYNKHIEPHSNATSPICIVLCNLSVHQWELWFHPCVIILFYTGFLLFFSLMNISTSLLHIVHVVLSLCPVIFGCHAFMDKKNNKTFKKRIKTEISNE